MPALRSANLALAFLLELGALAALAIWGAHAGSGYGALVLALALPLALALLWGRFAAPRSAHRLAPRPLLAFKLSVFGVAVVALLAAGAPVAAVVFGVAVVVNTVGAAVWDQAG